MRDQQNRNGHWNRCNQTGSGFADWLTTAINMMPSSDETGRPLYKGEQHVPLFLKEGSNKMGIANYAGPHTQVLKRLRRSDPPRGNLETDKAALGHDLRYELNSRLPKKQQIKANREADKIMVRKLNSSKKGDKRNKTIIKNAIRAKMFMEDADINKSWQSQKTRQAEKPEDDIFLKRKLDEIAQDGYGLSLPGMKLKNKVIKQHKKNRRRDQKGSGIASAIADKALPFLIKKLGVDIKFKKEDVKKVIDKAIAKAKGEPLKNVVNKVIFPLLNKTVLDVPKGEEKDMKKKLYKGILDFLKQTGNGITDIKQSGRGFKEFIHGARRFVVDAAAMATEGLEGAVLGSASGAVAGSAVPILGTAVGTVIGGVTGAVTGMATGYITGEVLNKGIDMA